MAIKVIGAGLGRTGTMSLKMALEQLGYGQCFHMVELLNQPQLLPHFKQLYRIGITDWERLFDNYQSTTDYPTCLYYREILEHYPRAKVVLTIRDPEQWYNSVRQTIYRGKPKNVSDALRLIRNLIRSSDTRKVAPVFRYADQLIWSGQFQSTFEDKNFALQCYQKHIDEVIKNVPADQLLIFDVREGWAPLCQFLGVPIPAQPFPRSHQRQSFNEKMNRLLYDGVLEL